MTITAKNILAGTVHILFCQHISFLKLRVSWERVEK